jgi:hypothetical protein
MPFLIRKVPLTAWPPKLLEASYAPVLHRSFSCAIHEKEFILMNSKRVLGDDAMACGRFYLLRCTFRIYIDMYIL